ncbi:MAG TPA: TolC family protein [Draconibacterium sp.]|nr:TolC family protein [Draconibacterium sp.]
MRNKIDIITLFTLIICVQANAQSDLETVLSQISRNNKTLQSNAQFWEAQKMQFKTGNTPVDPVIEYDYLSGSPADAGNQHEFKLVQKFDFPTVYVKKSQLAEQQTAQAEFELTAARQNILLDAKTICLELVYRNKMHLQLEQQKNNNEKLLTDFQTRLDKGEGNILDVNKAKLQLIEIRREFQENLSDKAQLNERLTALNGGNQITFTDTIYPAVSVISSFVQLQTDYENADPIKKSLEQQKLISQKSLELSKAMWLPKIEAGYRYQGILGQTYNGIHTGISIPLWENKNSVKLQNAKLLFQDLNLQDHQTTIDTEIKQKFEKYTNLKITLNDYQTAFESINSTRVLNKALSLGEISTIEYFLEMNYYNTALKNYLQTEKDYHRVIAELFKYQL